MKKIMMETAQHVSGMSKGPWRHKETMVEWGDCWSSKGKEDNSTITIMFSLILANRQFSVAVIPTLHLLSYSAGRRLL